MPKRLRSGSAACLAIHPYEQGFDLRLVPEKLTEPITWSKQRLVFVNSMSDLFHKQVPDEYIELVAKTMATADWHIYHKQWGGVRKCQDGRELNGRTYDEFPPITRSAVPDGAARKQLAASWPLTPCLPV